VLAAVDDPHAVAGVMKLFFREMPEPLLPFDTYDHFERASGTATHLKSTPCRHHLTVGVREKQSCLRLSASKRSAAS